MTQSGVDRELAIVMASHNRRNLTISSLDQALGQRPRGVALRAFVLDDASSDGTAVEIAARFPDVHVLQGSGDLYWAGGMRKAMASAMQHDFDYYLWLNDDTALDDGAIQRLIDTYDQLSRRGAERSIVVGSTRDPSTNVVTYGGVVPRFRWHPFIDDVVQPADIPLPASTMYGNCVLLPRSVVQATGNLDPVLVHRMADCDYGLRARKAGCQIYVAPGTFGTCSRNAPTKLPRRLFRGEASLRAELLGPKAYPYRAWLTYARRHGGVAWPIFWSYPYLKAPLSWLRGRLRGPGH